MPALDFKEIAPGHQGPQRDQFELFARDALEAMGFEIVSEPNRGPDAGRDLVVRDVRPGVAGSTVIDYLVSCKHNAHSGKAVGESDDNNLRDRLETHRCEGLIAFYSTLPSGTLSTHLNALGTKVPVLVLDGEKIEARLLDKPKGRAVAARYFPASFPKWVVSSQYGASTQPPRPAPVTDRFFLRQPHSDLADARAEAEARGVPVFAVIFDPDHSSHSRIAYRLGCFMEWEKLKRLVDTHFVPAVGPTSDAAFGALVPDDDPMEECRLVIFDRDHLLRTEPVYANPSVAWNRVLETLEQHEARRTAEHAHAGGTE